jgi:hypothetical protein
MTVIEFRSKYTVEKFEEAFILFYISGLVRQINTENKISKQ